MLMRGTGMVEYGCPEGEGNKKGRHARTYTYTTGEDNMQKFFNRKRKGFSMVEILIVLVILAIISGGGMMIAGRSSEKAKYVTAQKDLDVIQQAFIQYYNVRGNLAGIKTGKNDISAAFTDTNNQKVLQSFFSKELGDWKDPWGNSYRVDVSTAYDEKTGKGVITVFCADGEAVRSDEMSNPDGTATDMMRYVYNVNYD